MVDDYIALVQNDDVGNLIDVVKKNLVKKEDVSDFCVMMTLSEVKEYKKSHPNKKFFLYDVPEEIKDYINS